MSFQAQGHVHKISSVYRNTIEIKYFANRFIQEEGVKKDKKRDQLELLANFLDFRGPKPKIDQFKNLDEIMINIAVNILKIAESDNCPYSEFAVLYAMNNPGKDLKTSLPEMIQSKLESKGILTSWISKNYDSKRTYDITTNSVVISTIHSVKGLDYSVVFLLGLDFLKPKSWSEEQIEKLIYVAITRARYQLFIPYIAENRFISKLKKSL
jgi:superfamily I DNA/RNA helicase